MCAADPLSRATVFGIETTKNNLRLEVENHALIEHDLSDYFPIILYLKTSMHRFEEKRPEMRKTTPEKIEISL